MFIASQRSESAYVLSVTVDIGLGKTETLLQNEKENRMKKIVMLAVVTLALLMNSGILLAEGQGPTKEAALDQDIQMLRKDLRSDKKQIVAASMQLTEAEAVKFWPVYDKYTLETTKINDTRVALLKEYAKNIETLTDAQTQSLTKKLLGVDDAVTKLRIKYVPLFNKVLPVKKTARFMQIDRRLGLLLDVQLASVIPLVQP